MTNYNEFKNGFQLDSEDSSNGFKMTFENGWTVSVQWSNFNYCDNRSWAMANPDVAQKPNCPNAECAVWDTNGDWFKLTTHDDVQGWMTTDEVAELIARVQAFSPVLDSEAVDVTMKDWNKEKEDV